MTKGSSQSSIKSTAETEILSPEEAAEHIGLSGSTLAKMRCSGGGPRYLKIGRAVRYRLSDLEEWTATKTRGSTSEES